MYKETNYGFIVRVSDSSQIPKDPLNHYYQMALEEIKNGAELLPADPEPVPVLEVDMRRARLALLQQGLLDDVELAIASMPGGEGKAAQINWEYATVIRRDDSLVQAISTGLGLHDSEIDDLFALALSL